MLFALSTTPSSFKAVNQPSPAWMEALPHSPSPSRSFWLSYFACFPTGSCIFGPRAVVAHRRIRVVAELLVAAAAD